MGSTTYEMVSTDCSVLMFQDTALQVPTKTNYMLLKKTSTIYSLQMNFSIKILLSSLL